MNIVKSGERYKSKFNYQHVTVRQVHRHGVGFKVTFVYDGDTQGLQTSRTSFLECFDLTADDIKE